jgi:hypothetical protein
MGIAITVEPTAAQPPWEGKPLLPGLSFGGTGVDRALFPLRRRL